LTRKYGTARPFRVATKSSGRNVSARTTTPGPLASTAKLVVFVDSL
jgi:hypothetical protein